MNVTLTREPARRARLDRAAEGTSRRRMAKQPELGRAVPLAGAARPAPRRSPTMGRHQLARRRGARGVVARSPTCWCRDVWTPKDVRKRRGTRSTSRASSTSAGRPGSTGCSSPANPAARPSSPGPSPTRRRCTACSRRSVTLACRCSRPPHGPDLTLGLEPAILNPQVRGLADRSPRETQESAPRSGRSLPRGHGDRPGCAAEPQAPPTSIGARSAAERQDRPPPGARPRDGHGAAPPDHRQPGRCAPSSSPRRASPPGSAHPGSPQRRAATRTSNTAIAASARYFMARVQKPWCRFTMHPCLRTGAAPQPRREPHPPRHPRRPGRPTPVRSGSPPSCCGQARGAASPRS